MDAQPASNLRGGEVVVPCPDLDEAIERLGALGFRLESIFPADDPAVAVVAGHGLRLRLERGAEVPAPVVRLICRDPAAALGGARELALPGGARIALVPEGEGLELPPLAASYAVARAGAGAWHAGRAGMQYRDLIPDRQGGRFIASHIRVPAGGPVPDYVHYHSIRFQLIYCHRGWVRVVYEGQGEPFVMEPGDCVLQPPRIRHRVLECAPGLEVIELTSPARHETRVDHELELPTPPRPRELERPIQRYFEGQRFARHRAAEASWEPAGHAGWLARELGIAAATHELMGAQVLRPAAPGARLEGRHEGELYWGFVLRGAAVLDGEHRLEAADAFAVPAGRRFELRAEGADLEWLLVTVR